MVFVKHRDNFSFTTCNMLKFNKKKSLVRSKSVFQLSAMKKVSLKSGGVSRNVLAADRDRSK
jgi:hypothetical protein